MEPLYIAIEIGGTKQQVALGNSNGDILRKKTVKLTISQGAEDILEWLETAVRDMVSDRIEAVIIGFGGPVSTVDNKVITSIQVEGWDGFDLVGWFYRQFSLPVKVINDTVAGGLAEKHLGAGKNADIFFYTNMGTGIGGGLYIGDKIYDGLGYGASYLGQIWVPNIYDFEVEKTYNRLEYYCSGLGFHKRIGSEGYVPEESLLYHLCHGEVKAIDGHLFAEAIRRHDVFSLEEMHRMAKTMAIGISSYLALVSPDVICIGGGLSNIGRPLMDSIQDQVKDHEFVINKDKYHIVQSEFMDDAVLVGCLVYGKMDIETSYINAV